MPSGKHGMKRERVKKHGCAAGPNERQYTQTQTLWAVSSAKHGMKWIKGTKRETKNMGVLVDPMGGRQDRLVIERGQCRDNK